MPRTLADATRARRDRAVDALMPRLVAHGVCEVSANGVLGDPAGAGGTEGRRLLEDGADQLVGAVDELVASLDAAAARRA